MAHANVDLSNELTQMRPGGRTLGMGLMAAGVALVLIALAAALASAGGGQRFWFAYLFGLAAVTAVSCASIIFTLINYLVRAGWITNVRRILETMAVQIVLVSVLALPIVGLTLVRHGTLYSWAKPSDTPIYREAEHEDAKPEQKAAHVTEAVEHTPAVIAYPNEQVAPGVQRPFSGLIAEKAGFWLNPWFWAFRVLVYFASLSAIAYSYWSGSVKQDATGDLDISDRQFTWSGPLLIVAGFFTTFIAFDVFMSLDPEWFSTMYGVYFFASGTQAMWAIVALFVLTLQSRGYLRQSVTQEHRHDIGKFLWAFIFFFAYIAFDQYMLQWYANLPEETFFYDKRGYSTAHPTGYSPLVIALVLGRWLIPFAGLLSRHVKRNKFGLGFWAAWLLAFFFVDMYLLVEPEYSFKPLFGIPEICAFLGIIGLWLGNVIRLLGSHALRPVRDPRVHESLALQNF